jgi:uncharacterized protein involved in exopolysaccharide biosynthesis
MTDSPEDTPFTQDRAADAPRESGPRPSWRSIFRHPKLFLAVLAATVAVELTAAQRLQPAYQARAMLMVTSPAGVAGTRLTARDDETPLLKSFRVADPTVRELKLYLRTDNEADRSLFHQFDVDDDGFLPARYRLTIDRTAKRWVLALPRNPTLGDRGGATDSVGRKYGLDFLLEPAAFRGRGTRVINFTLVTPREAAVEAMRRLTVKRNGDFMALGLADRDPLLAAAVLNRWATNFIAVDARLTMQARGPAAATPPIMVLDSAVAPLLPDNGPRKGILLMTLFGGLGCATGLAMFADLVRSR